MTLDNVNVKTRDEIENKIAEAGFELDKIIDDGRRPIFGFPIIDYSDGQSANFHKR